MKASAIAAEDIEAKDLSYSDISQYVRSYFGDSTDGSIRPTERELAANEIRSIAITGVETGADGRDKIVYVENAVTGEIVSVLLSSLDRKKRKHAAFAKGNENTDDDNENAALLGNRDVSSDEKVVSHRDIVDQLEEEDSEHASAVNAIRSAFFFVQGIFAGFAFTTLYAQSSAASQSDFLLSYQSSAAEYRRFFYLLSSIALVGCLEKLSNVVLLRRHHHSSKLVGSLAF